MRRTFLSRIKTEYKVYAVLALLLGLLLAWAIIETGWLKPKTFDDNIFNEAACLDEKRIFNHSQAPRKAWKDVEDINNLIVVAFNNMGRGSGKFGVIDVDGSVVIEPIFENRLEIFDGILRTSTIDNQPIFFDLDLNELPIKEASKKFFDKKNKVRLLRNINMNPAFTLKSRSVLDSELVSLIEKEARLELFYLNFYKEPTPFYSLRMLSSKHDKVFVVMDNDLNMISSEYFLEAVYFESNGIAKVERICTTAYLNMEGKYIWYEDKQ